VIPQLLRLDPLDVDLALAELEPHTAELAEAALEEEWQARDYRRSRRARKRAGVLRTTQCGRCRLFTGGRAFCRHCGYVNGSEGG
jgi:hypothetical protein